MSLLLGSFLLFCMAGCSTLPMFTGEKIYRPHNMPIALHAPTQKNAHTVDLSEFAVGSVSSEQIDSGDIITVSIASGLDKTDTVDINSRVDESGNVDIPIIGQVPVAGMELIDAEAAIAAVAIQRRIFKSPHITVTMKQQRENKVTVIGAVVNQGDYKLPRGKSDLLAALVAAGGLSLDAGTTVEIRNVSDTDPSATPPRLLAENSDVEAGLVPAGHVKPVSQQSEKFTIDLVSSSREETQKYKLGDGAVVRVEKRDPKPFHVMGLVHKPGPQDYPVSKPIKTLEAVALAGGISNPVADKIYVIRQLEGSEKPAVIQVSMARAKRDGQWNIELAPGDIVSVEQTPATVLIEALRVLPFGVSASLGTFL
ncbi:polysaccharide biosynthesis/export family protein [Polystyrenella longa]|uniref:polysaccharide biosynthesis/export family protein n=1 Tax=Polystyrenella longa TaxID=2528007 RepID=UPI0018D22868|nr:polysaccharide biosynthesis/export family protein [Polystyrenella longa]